MIRIAIVAFVALVVAWSLPPLAPALNRPLTQSLQ